MKATETSLLTFLGNAPRFVIPIYQRTYSWEEKECRQLWRDILAAGQNPDVKAHFVGSIVYIEDGLSAISKRSPHLVIDGQQRLTTITLLLSALAEAVGEGEPLTGFSAKEIHGRYLVDQWRTGDERYKLLLTGTDRDTLKAIVAGHDRPASPSARVVANRDLFLQLLASGKNTVAAICAGLQKLVMVDIALSRIHDDPQRIFESMNSTGRRLSQADLVRNYVLMGLEPDLQTSLYEQFWRPMEEDFGQAAYSLHFDGFMRHYLTVRTRSIPRIDDVYEAYKGYAAEFLARGGSVEELVRDLRDSSRRYCAIALGQEKHVELRDAFHDIRELGVDVCYPFLLEVYEDHAAGRLTAEDFVAILRLVESYVFRRAICAIPTNSLNKTFSTLARSLDKDRYLDSVRAQFQMMRSYRAFPADEEFIRSFTTRNLYSFPRRSYWLRRYENHGRKERVRVDDYTIEHIMPQDPDLPAAWRQDLGPDWADVQARLLHTLGNLTLTGYNSEYSNRPFVEKRDMEGGFRHSPLRLNEGLGAADVWNEAAIAERAQRLAKKAPAIWSAPGLGADELAGFQGEAAPQPAYTIEDHPFLAGGPIREIFDAFAREVAALDPCVTVEFLKLYVAFKAETNFVDVVPQAKALRLSLNIDPQEVVDARGLITDVSDVGRWGNGDSEVRLSNMEDLPYVLGLVRQALERQMGSVEAAQ